jgi:hypothetical protein
LNVKIASKNLRAGNQFICDTTGNDFELVRDGGSAALCIGIAISEFVFHTKIP